jgi:hypothetical protein
LEAAKYVFAHFSTKEAAQIDRIKGAHVRVLALVRGKAHSVPA